MIYPSIDKILNFVDSKYALVYVVAQRSKEMTKTKHYQIWFSLMSLTFHRESDNLKDKVFPT